MLPVAVLSKGETYETTEPVEQVVSGRGGREEEGKGQEGREEKGMGGEEREGHSHGWMRW